MVAVIVNAGEEAVLKLIETTIVRDAGEIIDDCFGRNASYERIISKEQRGKGLTKIRTDL